MKMMNSNIGVVIPIDTEKNLKKIELTLFSLLGQTVSPATVYLICSEKLQENLYLHEISHFYTFQAPFELKFIYVQSDPEIYQLLNIGLENVAEKYIAFAIAGEVLYPNAYELLMGKMIPNVAIVFSKIIRKKVQDCNGQFYATNLLEGENFSPEFWEEYYFNEVGYLSLLLNKELISKESLYFSDELSLQMMLGKFLTRISGNVQKNVESFNVRIGEKWIFAKDNQSFENEHILYQEKMSYTERICFLEPIIKKEKVSLYNKVIPFMKYLRYHFFK